MRKPRKPSPTPAVPGSTIEVAVLEFTPDGSVCRRLDDGSVVTCRVFIDDRYLVPGVVARVRVEKSWTFGQAYLAGRVEAHRVDLAPFGLKPLRLEPRGLLDPAELWEDDGEPRPEWLQAIVARGPREAFELERRVPGAGKKRDPLLDAIDLLERGAVFEAEDRAMALLARDLRCIGALQLLGNERFRFGPEIAILHYEVGYRLGEQAMGPGFDGFLPWGLLDNRPFLVCMHGYGLCLWRLGRFEEAEAVFERLLGLNPSDNQGIRDLLPPVKARRDAARALAELDGEDRGEVIPFAERPRRI